MTQLNGKIEKGWGYELIWASTDKYCGKILVFDKVDAKFSMHFHNLISPKSYCNYCKNIHIISSAKNTPKTI